MSDRLDSAGDLDSLLKRLVTQLNQGDAADLAAQIPAIAQYIAANP